MKKSKIIKLVLGLIYFIIAIFYGSRIKVEGIISIIQNKEFNHEIIIGVLLYFISYLFLSLDVIKKAFKKIKRGKFLDENFLMLIASFGALLIGEYIEGIAVMILYQIGEMFEHFAIGKSRKSIKELINIRPNIAHLKKETIIDVSPEEVKVDEIITVLVGEIIPLDGEVVSGNSIVDMKSLTGESKPIDVYLGVNVLSGSLNLGGTIDIKVSKPYELSTVSKILELVENASNKKTKTENFIGKFALVYTPIVVILAVVLFLVFGLISNDYLLSLKKALNFLVISCPCALVISVPLSFFSGIGAASKVGVLVKGSNYFELLNKANIFVFDKTGTLTKGNFVVNKVCPTSKSSTLELLEVAYLCEKNSNHPISKSIMKYILENNLSFSKEIKETKEIPGFGIICYCDDSIMLAGNKKLFDDNNIIINQHSNDKTTIYFGKNNKYIGYIEIVDEIKEESYILINKLKKQKYKTIMLSGDNEQIAKETSNVLGLTNYYANLLPNDKVEKLEEILNKKTKNDCVVYLGDGINDAPVLMMADVGISMGKLGSDSAIEASDVVLMNDDLLSLLEAKKIAKKTINISKQNIIFALTIKFIVLIYSVFSNNPLMLLAIFADVGVSVIAICNSLRALKINKHEKR